MKRYDSESQLISPIFNVWGPSRESQPGYMSAIFDYGEFLGDIEVTKLLKVFRTSALYEAKRMVPRNRRGGLKEEKVLLKVAHNNAADQIKREAVLLSKLAQAQAHPMLPTVLSPYQHVDPSVQQRPYGKTVFQDETKYYIVLKYAKGEFLRDVLIKNPQPWYQHAAWLTISLADAVAFLHLRGQHLLLNLSPESIMIRWDRDGIPRPLLVDLSMATEPTQISHKTVREFVPPAYIAPELLDPRGGPYGAQTDVYGMGLLIYEMLTGHPAHPYKIRLAEDVRNAVLAAMPTTVNRGDLSDDIAAIIHQAIDKAPARRQPDIRTFAKQLRVKFGEVPPERRRGPSMQVILGILAVIALLVLVYVILSALTKASV